jgi:uridine kinase
MPSSPVVVGLAGPSGSGKSVLAEALRAHLGPACCTILPVDNYYRDLSHLSLEERGRVNFDHPDALDADRVLVDLHSLIRGESAPCPIYDFATHGPGPDHVVMNPAPLIMVEGIFALGLPNLKEIFDHRWYVDLDSGICLDRRLIRDVQSRGRSPEEVVQRFEAFVRPALLRHVEPQKHVADLVLDGALPTPDLLAIVLERLDRNQHRP